MELKSTFFGRFYVLPFVEYQAEKMVQILKVMGKTYEEYQLPIDYDALGIVEC